MTLGTFSKVTVNPRSFDSASVVLPLLTIMGRAEFPQMSPGNRAQGLAEPTEEATEFPQGGRAVGFVPSPMSGYNRGEFFERNSTDE